MAHAELHLLLLAAGGSSRFGSPKQLARLDGQPLLRIMLARAVEVAGQAVTVVLGAAAPDIAPLLGRSPATVVINSNWREGIASSIRAGIERLPGSCSGVLLLLADQAGVTVMDMQRLADTWRRQPRCIVAAQYSGVSGVPVIFPRSDFATLRALRGDRGAQSLLHRSPDRLVGVPLAGAAWDIDTLDDLARPAP